MPMLQRANKPRISAASICPHCRGPAVKLIRKSIPTVRCARGHSWHTCQVHNLTVNGTPSKDSGCTCYIAPVGFFGDK